MAVQLRILLAPASIFSRLAVSRYSAPPAIIFPLKMNSLVRQSMSDELEDIMSILWTIIIGFVAGTIAKLLHSGPNEPSGFILTTVLGIVGAFVATFLGQAIGWYRVGEGAGFIGATVGAIIVLVVWGMLARRTA
jgi:uncharacterized membrane protein YeaQ/YmgE (transglycosylase-associated protein family)